MNKDDNTFLHSDNTHLDFLREAYSLLIDSYEDLKIQKYNSSGKNENTIRDDLVRIAEQKEATLKFEWDTESRNLQKSNRLDITLITPLSLGAGIEQRLGIECKIIKDGHEYIDTTASNKRPKSPTNGLMSFITNKYVSKMSYGGMIGFIKEGKINDKISVIDGRLKKHTEIETITNLTFYKITKDFKHSYESKHKRNKNGEIEIYHLFFDFS